MKKEIEVKKKEPDLTQDKEDAFFLVRWIHSGSELYDGLGFALFRRFITSVLNGWFVYTRNHGALNVGAATFFGVLSVIPVLSCGIFLLGVFYGSTTDAHLQFFTELKAIMPPTSHVLVDEVGTLTLGHLHSTPLSFFNAIILIWAAKGFFGNLTTGLLKVTNTKSYGGQVMENIRALASVVAFCLILFMCMELSSSGSIIKMLKDLFSPHYPSVSHFIGVLAHYQVFTIPSTVGLVSLLFKWHLKTPLFACVEGAVAFIVGFFLLKSFHWIYLHYHQQETIELYGGFAPMVIGILWGYFMLTAFYVGACVASLPRQGDLLNKIPKVTHSWDTAA